MLREGTPRPPVKDDEDDLSEQFQQNLQLVDGRAFHFLLKRLDVVKQENENLKQQTTTASSSPAPPSLVEQGVIEAAKAVARISAGLVRQDVVLFNKAQQFARAAANVKSLEKIVRDNMSLINGRDEKQLGWTLLHTAASYGNLAGCKLLIESLGMSVWTVDLIGRTPLHLAASGQFLELCEYLTTKAEEGGRSARGESAPLDLAGLTPAAASALALNPYSENQKQNKMEFEIKRKSVKQHLHVLGDSCISPRKTPSTTLLASRRKSRLSTAMKKAKERVNYGYHLSTGWGVRMEDVVAVKENILDSDLNMFCVLDGHGGVNCAEKCKQMLEQDEFWTRYLPSSLDEGELNTIARKICFDLEEYLKSLPEFQLKPTETVQAIGGEKAKVQVRCKDESGTTFLMALITPKHVCVAHVGDSRASLIARSSTTTLLLDQSVSASSVVDKRVTRDHKLSVNDPEFVAKEIERINQAGGFLTSNNLRVGVERTEEGAVRASLGMTRSLGDFWAKIHPNLPPNLQAVSCEPDVVVKTREEWRDYYLFMASDGIWDVMDEKAVGELVRVKMMSNSADEEDELAVAAQAVCDRCLEPDLDTQDNMSVILIDLWRSPSASDASVSNNNNNNNSSISGMKNVVMRRPIFDGSPSE